MTPPKLYEFPVSHYCEKVRWALDHKGIVYQRVCLVPVLHVPIMLMRSRQTQVPMLQLGNRRIANSPHILATLEEYFQERPSLMPDDAEDCGKALALCAFFDKDIGIHLRRLAYFHALPNRAFMLELLSAEQSAMNRVLVRHTLPLITRVMAKSMRINAANYQKSLLKFNAAVDRLDAALQPTGYLIGSQFSIADLTAAALLAPLVQPEKSLYGTVKNAPPAFNAFCNSYAHRPFFKWVKDIYHKHR